MPSTANRPGTVAVINRLTKWPDAFEYPRRNGKGTGHMRRYPRDMTGYGATPPVANWPGGAKIAVQIVLNYEEGGENNILHGDAASEASTIHVVRVSTG